MQTNHPIKTLALVAAVGLAIGACSKTDKNTDKTPATPPAASQPTGEFIKQAEPPKADGTVSMLLPDFAQLVAQEGGSVVNIQAYKENNAAASHQGNADSHSDNDPFSEFFKRLIPNQPDFSEEGEDENNFGSGVIISSDGYILTNAHVVKGLDHIKVSLNDKREYTAKIIGTDDTSDIALLKIDANDLPVAKIGNPTELKSGEWVAAIGAPFGFDNSITAGIVSAKGRSLPNESYTPFIQTDVAINPGNSGGPLFNLKGQVVGINSQIYSRSGGFMGISFAIPIDIAMNVAEQLKATGKVQRGQLGVIIQEVSHDLSKSFGLDKPVGALVAKVMPDSPAAKSGVQVGDIIRSVNGGIIRSSSDLPMVIGAIAPGKEITLGIWRKGAEVEVKVVLNALDDKNTPLSDNGTPPQYANSLGSFEVKEAGLTFSIEKADNGQELVVRQAIGVAARAGLRRGDVVSEFNGRPVKDEASLREALKQSGNTVSVLVQRGDHSIFMALNLNK